MQRADLMLHLEVRNQRFVTADEIKEFCEASGCEYGALVKYLGEQKRLQRILRGIFHVTPRHRTDVEYNHRQLVAKALELKGVGNWYYGLHSALKFNNMTHEYFAVDDVVSDSIYRQNTMVIAHHKFRFVKIAPSLIGFGTIEHNGMRYSDREKTILDFVYLGKYNGMSDARAVAHVADWCRGLSGDRLARYSGAYPKSVRRLVGRVLDEGGAD